MQRDCTGGGRRQFLATDEPMSTRHVQSDGVEKFSTPVFYLWRVAWAHFSDVVSPRQIPLPLLRQVLRRLGSVLVTSGLDGFRCAAHVGNTRAFFRSSWCQFTLCYEEKNDASQHCTLCHSLGGCAHFSVGVCVCVCEAGRVHPSLSLTELFSLGTENNRLLCL